MVSYFCSMSSGLFVKQPPIRDLVRGNTHAPVKGSVFTSELLVTTPLSNLQSKTGKPNPHGGVFSKSIAHVRSSRVFIPPTASMARSSSSLGGPELRPRGHDFGRSRMAMKPFQTNCLTCTFPHAHFIYIYMHSGWPKEGVLGWRVPSPCVTPGIFRAAIKHGRATERNNNRNFKDKEHRLF